MKLTKELSDKISEAWQYGAASSCRYAMSQLDQFVNALLNGGRIQIEEESLTINDFSEFLIWKNKKWIFQQIPVCNSLSTEEKRGLINELVSQFNLTRIKFTETDPNNHYFNLTLKNVTGEFQVQLGKITNMDDIPAYTINVKELDFKKNLELYVEFENGKNSSYQFQRLNIK
jgi:hypothetical protein